MEASKFYGHDSEDDEIIFPKFQFSSTAANSHDDTILVSSTPNPKESTSEISRPRRLASAKRSLNIEFGSDSDEDPVVKKLKSLGAFCDESVVGDESYKNMSDISSESDASEEITSSKPVKLKKS